MLLSLVTPTVPFRDPPLVRPPLRIALARAEWLPRVLTWDEETGLFERVEGPEGFTEYQQALEASRFLTMNKRRRKKALGKSEMEGKSVVDILGGLKPRHRKMPRITHRERAIIAQHERAASSITNVPETVDKRGSFAP